MCTNYSNVTNDVILPLGWGGSICLGESLSRVYPNMCAKFGCGPTVASKKRGRAYRQTDKGTLQLYIVETSKVHIHLMLGIIW